MFYSRKQEERIVEALRAALAEALAQQRVQTAASIEAGLTRIAAELKTASEAQRRELAISIDAEIGRQFDRRFTAQSGAIEAALADKLGTLIKSLAQKSADGTFRQFESLLALYRVLPLKAALPPTRGWAASPDLLLHLFTLVRRMRPAVVVELGSGVSTLVIAAALRETGSGRLLSLEHEEVHRGRTQAHLADEGLDGFADVLLAPLSPWKPGRQTKLGTEWRWYSVPEPVKALARIDLLLVDGPPGKTCRNARYPALPEFFARLHAGSIVLLDDANRKEEKTIAKAWAEEYGVATQAQSNFEKGLVTLRAAARK